MTQPRAHPDDLKLRCEVAGVPQGHGRIGSIALKVTAPSLSSVDATIREFLTPYFRFAAAPFPPNFSA